MAGEPTQAISQYLEIPQEAYYIAVAQYIENYLYKIEGHLPKSDSKLWKMSEWRNARYYQAVEIRAPPMRM